MQSMFCVMIIPALLKIKVLLKVAFVSGNAACKFKVYICMCVCVYVCIQEQASHRDRENWRKQMGKTATLSMGR